MLRTFFGMAVLLCFAQTVTADDVKDIQGEWKPVAIVGRGKQAPEAFLKKLRVRIQGNKLTFNDGKRDDSYQFQLDPKQTPKAIDTRRTTKSGVAKGPTISGIYSLEKGQLRLCFDDEKDAKRPTKFESPENSKIMLFTFERAK